MGDEELGEEELLFTSPLRLLLAIDGELSAGSGSGDADIGEGGLLTGDLSGLSSDERRCRLQELRADVQALWDRTAESQ